MAGVIRVLVLGCGEKQAASDYHIKDAQGQPYPADRLHLITLDANPDVSPQIVCELGRDPIPLDDDSIHLIVALHIIEHIGTPGDAQSWFFFWEEMYRVLAPGGTVQFECPYYSSLWAWADPTHVRAISEYTFLYLNQNAYRHEGSAIPRFRIKADFAWAPDETGRPKWELVPDYLNPDVMAKEPVSHIRGVLAARKPLRPWWRDAVTTETVEA